MSNKMLNKIEQVKNLYALYLMELPDVVSVEIGEDDAGEHILSVGLANDAAGKCLPPRIEGFKVRTHTGMPAEAPR